MRCGWQLSDVPYKLSWGALFAFIKHLGSDSAHYRFKNPEYAAWTGPELVPNLLAGLLDATNILIWQNSKAGQRGRDRPKPIKRPWSKDNTDRIGRGAIPMDQWDEWWGDGSPNVVTE